MKLTHKTDSSDEGNINFLNTKGTNKDEVPAELVAFLHYLEQPTDAMADASDSPRIRQIHKRVCEVKKSEDINMRFLQELEEKNYARQEGFERGELCNLISLVQKKISRGKSLETSADELEMDISKLKPFYQAVLDHPDKSPDEILELMNILPELSDYKTDL